MTLKLSSFLGVLLLWLIAAVVLVGTIPVGEGRQVILLVSIGAAVSLFWDFWKSIERAKEDDWSLTIHGWQVMGLAVLMHAVFSAAVDMTPAVEAVVQAKLNPKEN